MILNKSKIDKILEKLINHEITITHIVNNGGDRLTTSGVLMKIDGEIISIIIYNVCGGRDIYYLNRKASQLYSIVDEGKYVKPKDI